MNAAHPHGQGPITPEYFTPYSKNPTLSKFFMQLGRGEELGSGVLNVSKYLPLYAKGAKPQFVEGNPFVTVIPLPTDTGGTTREKTREKILRLIQERPSITTEELSSVIAVSPKGIEWNLKKLKEEGVIRRVGADKGGHWEVEKDQQP